MMSSYNFIGIDLYIPFTDIMWGTINIDEKNEGEVSGRLRNM